MIDGILLIDKEENITSYTAIRMLKRILPKGQKIGHAGTLDPFATGF
jgi:tRNA pseudouridine55 synthase